MQQVFSLLSWRLFTAQHISGIFSPAHYQELNDCSGSLWFYIRIVVIVVLCSWLSRQADRPDHEHSTTLNTIRR
jgi:FtsH-binding integral membrane protein